MLTIKIEKGLMVVKKKVKNKKRLIRRNFSDAQFIANPQEFLLDAFSAGGKQERNRRGPALASNLHICHNGYLESHV